LKTKADSSAQQKTLGFRMTVRWFFQQPMEPLPSRHNRNSN